MFKNLIAEMAREGVTCKDLADRLELSNTTITNKIHGRTDWTLREIKIISGMFPNVEIEYLFDNES